MTTSNEELMELTTLMGLDERTIGVARFSPLVVVAWADGCVQEQERRLIMRTARESGLDQDELWKLDEWLSERPSETFFDAVPRFLQHVVHAADYAEDIESLPGLCLQVAKAAGGLYGVAFSVSSEERSALAEIEGVLFESEGGTRGGSRLPSDLKGLVLEHVPERFLGPVRRAYYSVSLRNTRLEELMDGPVLKKLIGPGDHVADIGASVGYYTKTFSEIVGPEGKVTCVEPLPTNVGVLRFNRRAWNLVNVSLHPIAISDRVSKTTMNVPATDGASTRVYEGKLTCECSEDDDCIQFEVETTSLDRLFDDGTEEVKLIKLDTMCHELTAVVGAKKLLEAQKPAWLIAVYTDPNEPNSDARKLFSFMRDSYGYQIYWFDESEQALRPWLPGENAYRFFFLRDGHLNHLREQGVVVMKASPARS